MALIDPGDITRETLEREERDGPKAIAFFGRIRPSRRVSLPIKSNGHEEAWELFALLLFAVLIGAVVWLHFQKQH